MGKERISFNVSQPKGIFLSMGRDSGWLKVDIPLNTWGSRVAVLTPEMCCFDAMLFCFPSLHSYVMRCYLQHTITLWMFSLFWIASDQPDPLHEQCPHILLLPSPAPETRCANLFISQILYVMHDMYATGLTNIAGSSVIKLCGVDIVPEFASWFPCVVDIVPQFASQFPCVVDMVPQFAGQFP